MKLRQTAQLHGSTVNSIFLHNHNVYTGAGDHVVHEWHVREGELCFAQTFSGEHTGAVSGIAVLSNMLFSSSFDRTVVAWNILTGDCEEVLRGHTDSVSSVVSCCGVLVSGSWDGTIRLWDPKRLGSSKTIPMESGVDASRLVAVQCLESIGRLILVGTMDGTLVSFDLTKYNAASSRNHFIGHVSSINALAACTDQVAAAGSDGNILVWLLRTQEQSLRIKASNAPIFTLGSLTDGNLASGGQEGVVSIWNMLSGELVSRTDGLHDQEDAGVFSLACAQNLLIAGRKDGRVEVCEYAGQTDKGDPADLDVTQVEMSISGIEPGGTVVAGNAYDYIFRAFNSKGEQVSLWEAGDGGSGGREVKVLFGTLDCESDVTIQANPGGVLEARMVGFRLEQAGMCAVQVKLVLVTGSRQLLRTHVHVLPREINRVSQCTVAQSYKMLSSPVPKATQTSVVPASVVQACHEVYIVAHTTDELDNLSSDLKGNNLTLSLLQPDATVLVLESTSADQHGTGIWSWSVGALQAGQYSATVEVEGATSEPVLVGWQVVAAGVARFQLSSDLGSCSVGDCITSTITGQDEFCNPIQGSDMRNVMEDPNLQCKIIPACPHSLKWCSHTESALLQVWPSSPGTDYSLTLRLKLPSGKIRCNTAAPVSYTHLTLPTKRIV
eukprot:TRINITY_DN8635_c0_g2_i1.p1 TRINITY_DN8635_c0_g2~~TRINITY_DN8635_c0_g2_i1.p1  ORF type:complete len:666 (-),score=120.27 TRINITY_DN8635_c0_g2_i1:157-2154(-)